MAKGNFLLGYARGSVGDVTFSRVKGNQVAKARNRNPANPNTIPQAMQRSLFADAVRFYTRGVQNAFKFAFERKLENESDYNAFMRLNVNRGVRIGKNPDSKYPAIGDWLVADGSITPPQVQTSVRSSAPGDYAEPGYYQCNDSPYAVHSQADDTIRLSTLSFGFSAAAAPATIGALSTALLATYPQLRAGDFVTMLLVAQGTQGSDLFPSSHGYDEGLFEDPSWNFAQFTIDEGNTAAISTIYHSAGSTISCTAADEGAAHLMITRDSQFIPVEDQEYGTIAAGAVIFSRQTASGLLVSTAPLALGYQCAQAVDYCRQQPFIDAVMVDWGAADPAILQGYFVHA